MERVAKDWGTARNFELCTALRVHSCVWPCSIGGTSDQSRTTAKDSSRLTATIREHRLRGGVLRLSGQGQEFREPQVSLLAASLTGKSCIHALDIIVLPIVLTFVILVEQDAISAIGRKDPVAALTDPHQTELQVLLMHFSPTFQYDTLTQAARKAYDAGQWNDLRKIGAQRAALNYVPPSGFAVASGRARLEALRTKVEQRRQTHLDALQMPEIIDYVVACTDCLDEIKGLLGLGTVSQAASPQVLSVSRVFTSCIHSFSIHNLDQY